MLLHAPAASPQAAPSDAPAESLHAGHVRRAPAPPRRWSPLSDLALLALVAVILEIGLDVLPDAPAVWVLTPMRIVLIVGLVCGTAGLPIGVRRPRAVTMLHLAMVAVIATAALATVRTGHDWSLLRGLITGVGVYLLAAVVARGRRDAWPALTAPILASVAVASGAALRQSVLGEQTGFCRASVLAVAEGCDAPGAVVRATGTFANPNLLAAYLVVLLPLCVLVAVTLPAGSPRLLGLALAGCGYAAVLATMSRAGLLAAVVGMVALGVLHRPTRRLVLAVGVSAVALVVAAAGSVLAAGGSLRRGTVWRAALDAVRDESLGHGLGRAGVAVSERVPGPASYAHAHNVWLDWLLDTGVPGLAAVVVMTVVVARLVLRLARAGSQAAVALGAGLAAFAVMALADDPAQTSRIALLLWLVLGCMVGIGAPVVSAAELARGPRHARR
ncbi:O-antigen ligase family protein [Actinomycetota bacterium]